MTTIGSSTFIHDATLLLRDLLSAGVTDPLLSSRPSTSNFVVTQFPEKIVIYPLITVQKTNISSRRMGISSEMLYCTIPFEVRAWCRSIPEKDSITSQIINTLKSSQYSTGSGTVDSQLYGYDILSATNVDESGKNPKSKVIQVQYQVII